MALKGRIGGFVLAGGESSRMGRPKALLELAGEPMVVRTAKLVGAVAESVIVIGPPQTYELLGLRAFPDDFPGAGPLGGIATALGAVNEDWNLVVACDLPYLTREWLEHLAARALASAAADAVIPMTERGAEPLCAMYNKRCEAPIRAALTNGTRKVTDALARVHVENIAPAEWKAFDSGGLLFKNMNSPADFEDVKAKLEGRASG